MSLFGRIVSDDTVEDAVIATLRKWLPTMLSEVERQRNLQQGYHERPQDYTSRTEFDKWPEEQLPLVIVVCPGISDDPVKEGRGIYRAKYDVGIVVVVSSIDKDSTRRIAQRMGAAVRAVLAKKSSLDGAFEGDVRGVDWIGTKNNELKAEDDRTIWANRQLFSVEIGNVLTKGSGPREPEPYDTSTGEPADNPNVIPPVRITKEPIPT